MISMRFSPETFLPRPKGTKHEPRLVKNWLRKAKTKSSNKKIAEYSHEAHKKHETKVLRFISWILYVLWARYLRNVGRSIRLRDSRDQPAFPHRFPGSLEGNRTFPLLAHLWAG